MHFPFDEKREIYIAYLSFKIFLRISILLFSISFLWYFISFFLKFFSKLMHFMCVKEEKIIQFKNVLLS